MQTITYRARMGEDRRSKLAGEWGLRAALYFFAKQAAARGVELRDGEPLLVHGPNDRRQVHIHLDGKVWRVELESATVHPPMGAVFLRPSWATAS